MKIKLPKPLTCARCRHKWIPRQADIRACPKCKSVLWDVAPIKKGEKENGK